MTEQMYEKPEEAEENAMESTVTLPSLAVLPEQLLQEDITAERAWTRQTLVPEDWLVPLSEACYAELEAVVKRLRTHPQPLQQLTPQMFSLPACTKVMVEVRRKLQQETGFVVIDHLPVERYSTAESTALAWLMASLMGQVVAQKWDGTRLYDVKDAGKPLGYGVRRSVTNLEQDFHTDGGWLRLPPAFVGLFCLQPAQAGGYSRCASLLTVHNELRRRHPDLLRRLYGPFWWDRQAEHGPEAPKFCRHAVYQYDGHTLLARYYEDYIKNGYALAGAALDTPGQAALAALRAIVDAPENWVEFRLEQGQLQYINNRQLAHARTAFDNAQAAAGTHRHLVRLWNRDEGTPALEG